MENRRFVLNTDLGVMMKRQLEMPSWSNMTLIGNYNFIYKKTS